MMRRREGEGAAPSDDGTPSSKRSSSTPAVTAGVPSRSGPAEATELSSSQVEERLRQYER